MTLLIAILITVLLAIPLGAVRDAARAPPGPARGRRPGRPPDRRRVFVGLLALIIPSFADQAQEFVDEVPAIVDDVEETVADITGSEPSEVGTRGPGVPRSATPTTPGELIGPLASLGLDVAGVLGAFLLILITAYYMAVSPEPLLDGVEALFPPDRRDWAADRDGPPARELDRLDAGRAVRHGPDRRPALRRPRR